MILKSKMFQSEYSDLKVEVIENGWITLYGAEGSISLGKAPNERIRLIKEAIEYSEMMKEGEDG